MSKAAKESDELLQDIFSKINSPFCSTQKNAQNLRQGTEDIKNVVAKTKQKIEERAQKNALDLRELSKILVAKRLEEAMNEAINKIGPNISEESKTQIRAIIRGYKFAELTQGTFLMNAVGATEKYLTDLCSQQQKLFDKANNKLTDIDNRINSWFSKIDSFTEKVDVFNKLEETEQIGKIIESMTNGIKNATTLDALCQKIDKFVNIDGTYKQLTGFDFNSKDMLLPVLSNIERNIGKKFIGQLKPFISKHIEVVKKIAETVKGIEKQVRAATEHFRKIIKQYEDMAKNIANELTSKLASEISSRVNINYTVGGGFGGGLNLPKI